MNSIKGHKKVGCKTRIIAAKQGSKILFGTPPKIAKLVNRSAMTVLRWAKENKPKIENGYELYFDIEKL
jgi:hypothetical protein